jgi:hypothetical protein
VRGDGAVCAEYCGQRHRRGSKSTIEGKYVVVRAVLLAAARSIRCFRKANGKV